MEFFISQVEVILPVVGFDFLRPKGKTQVAAAINEKVPAPRSQIELVLTSGAHGYEARAVEVDGEITVLPGSKATTKDGFSTNGYAPLRQQLIKNGRLVPTPDPQFLEFNADVAFLSASDAAAVIKNRNTNGRASWRLVRRGQTLKDWQDAQLVPPLPST